MDWCYVESHRPLTFVLFVSVLRPYALPVFCMTLRLLLCVGLSLGGDRMLNCRSTC
jgi:hypothetical protein